MGHERVVEVPPGPSHAGSVMADIGGDVGAAILYVPEDLAGLEIEIRRVGHAWDGTHTAVRERHVKDTIIWAAFFGSLLFGSYEARVRGDQTQTVVVEIVGGHVAETSWFDRKAAVDAGQRMT
jgi:hypothetical protein